MGLGPEGKGPDQSTPERRRRRRRRSGKARQLPAPPEPKYREKWLRRAGEAAAGGLKVGQDEQSEGENRENSREQKCEGAGAWKYSPHPSADPAL